ncbi:MAG: 5-formyltetrahydrofolate cyclo-ligase [Nitrospirota bacterium]|nr:5-formyltetrahydrofolate cyclo-ligase [Nitrospirota bacterium]
MKKDLRLRLLSRRDSITPEQKKLKDIAVKKKLFDLDGFSNAKSVLMYVSFRSETDTTGLLEEILKTGKKLVVPLVSSRSKTLTLYEIRAVSELVPGYMGILEPAVSEDRIVSLNNIDLAVIPGAGFDLRGNRLGYGGGYYDRLLGNADKHITTVALAYEEQIAEDIPAEPHDIKMDIIITDKRVIKVP